VSERKRLVALIVVMTSVSLFVGGIAVSVLYNSAIEGQKERLKTTAQSQARLIEAVARFNSSHNQGLKQGAEIATLSQIIDAHEHYKGFGETGEFTLARREGANIVFLLSHRHSDLEHPKPIPFDSELAEPMRRALSGESGTFIGLDYRGGTVVAAHEPVAELDLGIVAKIDLAEVQAPFVRSALIGFVAAVAVVVLGSLVFARVTNPMIVGIQESETRLRAILTTAVDPIITIDDQGIIESVNHAAEDTFGYQSAELVGRNVAILMPSPYRDEHDTYIANYLKTGEKRIIGIGRELEGLRRDGTSFPMELAISEVTLGDRRVFTGIARDITEKKRAEERALQAERLATIGQMVTGLAHESRNAIQRAKACQEMMALDLQGQSDLLNLSERTQQALDDLHRLYEELRGYAAPIRLELQECDVSGLWRKSWSDLEETEAREQIQFSEETNGVKLTCQIDPYRIEQVFRNILENSLDACSSSGQVVVKCAATALNGAPALQIALRDNGPGLTVEQAKSVFEPFFSTKKKGTGLGMAIAKRIVEAHGGEIRVANVGRPGAEIVMTLPRQPT